MQNFGKKKEAEINVTPLVDVMLVLLVIFMVATPMMQNDVEVNLPNIESSKNSTMEKKSVKLLILENCIKHDGKSLTESDLRKLLSQKNKESVIYIKADQNLKYQKIANVLDLLRQEGFSKIALVGKK